MSLVHRPLLASLRLAGIIAWTAVMAVPVGLCSALRLRRGWAFFLRRFWVGIVWLFGVRLVVRGAIQKSHPTLFIANHSSYLDIAILGSLLDACFVAKKDIEGWPVMGSLTRLGGAIFVDRKSRTDSARQRDDLAHRLSSMGESLVLFPEGTTSDGNRVLPFKSSLFAVAALAGPDGQPLTVQPVSVAYTRLDHLAMGRVWRPYYAWYGDMTLGAHAWQLLGLGDLTVELTFLPPVTIADYKGSRKALADHCHHVIARDVVVSLSGRQPPPVAAAS